MSDNRTTELVPCPWCGVDMKLHAINYPWADGEPGWNIWHEDMGEAGKRKCPMETGCYDTREEAIAVWNTRATKSCYATDYTHDHCKYSVNRGWMEDTSFYIPTLRHGTLTAEQVREAIEKRFDFDVWVPNERWQAIADDLNAELGSGKAKDLLLRTFGLAQMMHDCWLEECKAGDNVDVSACNAYSYEFDQIAQAMFDMGTDPNDSDYYRSVELGSGTCENVWAKFGKFKCSECAMEVNAISTNTTTPRPIAFCPNCGARIRKAVTQ